MASYAPDLRQRIIDAVARSIYSKREIAEIFGIQESFIYNLLHQARERGDIAPLPHGGGAKPKLTETHVQTLAGLSAAHPDATLAELSELLHKTAGIEVSISAVCKGLDWVALQSSAVGPDPKEGIHVMLGAIVAIAMYMLVLALFSPLILLAKIVVVLPSVSCGLTCTARLILVYAAYVALFEIPALAGVLFRQISSRHSRRRTHGLFIRKLTRQLFGPGFAFAGMRWVCTRPAPVIEDRLVIVLARHAGVLNGPLVIHLVGRDLGRFTLGIAKRIASWAPGIGAVYASLGIVSVPWTPAGRMSALHHLRDMALGAQPTDALVLFVEGGNFTAARRQQMIAALLAKGQPKLADQAARWRHVLAPQARGARLVAKTAPAADVLIFAHTGLEDLLACSGQIDYTINADGEIHTAWWHFPAEQVPHTPHEFQEWLTARWQDVDEWIADVRAGEAHVAVGKTIPALFGERV